MQWHLDGIVPVPDGRTGLPKVNKHGSLGEVIEATLNGSPCAIKLFTHKQVLFQQPRNMRDDLIMK